MSNNYTTTGGGNKTMLYALNSNWEVAASPFVTLDMIISTALTGHQKSKNLQAVLDHEAFDSTITGMFNTYLSESTAEATIYEDGGKGSVTDPTNSAMLAIVTSGENNASTKQRWVKAFVAKLQGGDTTFAANAKNKLSTTLVGIAAGSAITVTGAKLAASGLIAAPSDITIALNDYGEELWATSV